jgi:F-type H+-transporting ATPase subunit b
MLELLGHDTGLWVAISFALFAFLAFKMGRKSVLGGLDARIAEVKSEIENAERLRVEAQELLAQYQRKQRDAEKEASEIVARAQEQAKVLSKTTKAELEDTMKRREEQLADRLRRLEENAIAEIQSHAADLAVAATTEMIIKTLDEASNASLNENTIKSLSQKIN